MLEQVLHWSTLAVAFVLGLTVLLKKKARKERRSSGQWVILLLYKAVRRAWALVRAIDVGYLEYRRAIKEAPFEIENERCLGKLVKASSVKTAGPKAA
ncbi:MAG: hypothetical protein ACR2IV_19770 [Bryobacteraceae bacterium]